MAETGEATREERVPHQDSALASDVGMPHLLLGTYEGPLDLLLELARAQKVDLARISVAAMAAQFVAAVEAAIAGQRVPLGQMGDWLVATATLIALRARLLLPAEAPERRDADREAATLRRQLAERETIQRLADWLEQRPQLGRDVFARQWAELREEAGQAPRADITELLRACLRLLAQPLREAPWQPRPPSLWRVPAALAHLRALLATLPPEGLPLAQLVPLPELTGASALQRRAALASMLMAGLEVSREGELELDQVESFGSICVTQNTPLHDSVPDGQQVCQ
jgi:segregation and condensation protein A